MIRSDIGPIKHLEACLHAAVRGMEEDADREVRPVYDVNGDSIASRMTAFRERAS